MIKSRQVHLDFHTSEYIHEIGKQFQKEDFKNKLIQADINSITCFARCHHGWLYYPSIHNPTHIHPELLRTNLLIEQIDAAHEIGVQAPIYTTVQWDGLIAREHPDWLAVDEDGNSINSQGVARPHFYDTLCLNSPYRIYLKKHVQDIIDTVGVERIDGFFFDILFRTDCCCKYCQKKMKKLGLDVNSRKERLLYSSQMLSEFKKEMSTFIWEQLPGVTIFYNGSHIGFLDKKDMNAYSHIELESLPSGGWGYDHFPITMRYARNLEKEVIGMTGRFHTYWGDFHSLKNQAALEFECFNMLALGAHGCSIGDQLHPDGQMSTATYDLIGSVYQKIAKISDECQVHTQAVTEIAVLTTEEYWLPSSGSPRTSPSMIGVNRILQELNYQFNIIDSEMDFTQYKVLILPDEIPYSVVLIEKLTRFIQNGGYVLATYHSLIDFSKKYQEFFGIDYLGEGEYERNFILPNDYIGKNLPKEELVMYVRGADIKTIQAKEQLSSMKPYFNREGDTFCSHQHAPSSRIKGLPAGTQYGNVFYFSHPLFALYRKNGAKWIREIVKDVLEKMIPKKIVTHNGPTTLLTTMNQSKDKRTKLLHGLHYIIQKQTEDIYTIEDKFPLYDIELKIYLPEQQVQCISHLNDGSFVAFTQVEQEVSIHLPVVNSHFVLKIECEDE